MFYLSIYLTRYQETRSNHLLPFIFAKLSSNLSIYLKIYPSIYLSANLHKYIVVKTRQRICNLFLDIEKWKKGFQGKDRKGKKIEGRQMRKRMKSYGRKEKGRNKRKIRKGARKKSEERKEK